jgi:restriction endonuclease Mrr
MVTEETLLTLQRKIERRTTQFHKASRYLAELNAFSSSRAGPLADRLAANFEVVRDSLSRAKQQLQSLLSSEDARALTGFRPNEIAPDSIIIEANQELLKFLSRNPNYLTNLDSRAFEQLIARILADLGQNVELMRASHDGGKDIIIRSDTVLGRSICYVQCKRYSPLHPVGIDTVRELYGVHVADKVNKSMIVTTSYFTAEAVDFSKGLSFLISLKNYNDIVSWLRPYSK